MKKICLIVLCLTFIPAMLLGGCAQDIDTSGDICVYVAADGSDDKGRGTEKKPFATIERAQEKIRELRASENPPEGTVTVVIESGVYDISDGLTFTEEDSDTVYKAAGEVTLTGGVTLDASIAVDVPEDIAARLNAEALPYVRAYDLTKLGLTSEDWGKIYAYGAYSTASKYDGDTTGPAFADLYVGGERMMLARYPNKVDDEDKFALMRMVLSKGENANSDGWSDIRNPEPGTLMLTGALFSRISSWAALEEVWMFGYFCYDWADMTTPIGSIDAEKTSITPAFTSYYGYSGPKFYFFNVLEELDAPGEWYLDRESGIVYMYPPEDAGDAAVTMSITTSDLITVSGAEILTFEGLEITCTRGNGIVASGDSITVKDCEVSQVSISGISLTGYSNTVSGCEVHDVGGDAIILVGGNRATLTPSDSIAVNNRIWKWSEITRTYKAAVAMYGVGLTAAHNEMFNAPHLAVTYSGNDITVEYNEIYDVCYNTKDGGAIYAGRSWSMYGCVIRYNYIHDITSSIATSYGPIGIYLDDALSGQTVYGNILQDCGGLAMLIGGGRDNIIENNLFINVRCAMQYDERAWDGYFEDGWFAHMVLPEVTTLWNSLSTIPYQTGIWAEKYPALAVISTDRSNPEAAEFPVNPAGNVIENNVVYIYTTSALDIADSVYVYSTVGGNLVMASDADPGFADYENGDLILKEDSVIFTELPGFEALPFDQMGRIE